MLKNNTKIESGIKNQGKIYTPVFIVNNILDLTGYRGNILKKNVIDNSCGDGAFLKEVVHRYCSAFLKKNKMPNPKELKTHLEKYIHGIEIDDKEANKCVDNLNKIVEKFGVRNVRWDIVCGDTLDINTFAKKMDFVVGNPPYVRVHNLADSYHKVKKFNFSQNGMTDLYIVFFEIGFRMLSSGGKMCLITPSSCLKSKAGENFRKFVFGKRNLVKIVDLEHFQPFEATTYTMITLFEMGKKNDYIEYYTYDEKNKLPVKMEDLDYTDIFIEGKIYVSKRENLRLLQDMENYNKSVLNKILVKNGFATLADDVFIRDFKFENLTINILKASTNEWRKCIFPYDKNGVAINIGDIKKKYPEMYEYLSNHKERLENRNSEKNSQWHLFGRSQAIKDVFKDKIAVNSIIKNKNNIKITFVPTGSGVYGGLYILSRYSLEEIKNILISDDFIEYLKLLKNYKSGGYYTFSSSELQKFLTYKLRKYNYEQSTIFASHSNVV